MPSSSNRLLASLSTDDFDLLAPHLESTRSIRRGRCIACAQRRAIKTIMIAAANGEAGQTTHDDRLRFNHTVKRR